MKDLQSAEERLAGIPIEAQWPDRFEAPQDSPNVVVILLDDVGFGQLGCFGGDIDTPHIDRLAAEGLRYSNFHTTALCSPTRASLLTGRNPHSVGFGHIAERSTGHPGYTARLPDSSATLARLLTDGGYNSWAVGKWHLLPPYEAGPAGPFDRWPLGRGFERFYGFLGGSTDQHVPELYRDNTPTSPPATPDQGYHLTADLADEAISRIREQKGVAPHKPFFLYFAPGACHAPHQAPRAFIESYRGRYDDGWDVARTRILQRQRALGVVAADAALPDSNPGVPEWDSLSPEEQAAGARMMEVYAGFLTHTDAQIGRLMDFLRDSQQLDRTLVILLSDNGASAEGGPAGSVDEGLYFNDLPQRASDVIDHLDELGGPGYYNHYPWGWAQAGNTPFRWYKQFTHAGGITNGCIFRCPQEINDPGGIRTQYHHVVDLAPTILEVAGVPVPDEVGGVSQQPMHGVSMRYSFNAADAPGRRTTQHYEMWGNRGMWSDGWMAVSRLQPDAPGDWPPLPLSGGLREQDWELYHHDSDPAECVDLADDHPAELGKLVDQWWSAAHDHQVLPIDTRSRSERWSPQPAPLGSDPDGATFYGRCGPYERGVAPKVAGRSFHLRAEATFNPDTSGVLYSIGSRHGGYSWYLLNGELVFEVNLMSISRHLVTAPLTAGPGRHVLACEVAMAANRSAIVAFSVDGAVMGSGAVPRLLTVAPIGGGRTHIGFDPESPVSDRYTAPFTFTGDLHRLDVRLPAHDHPALDDVEAEEARTDLRAQ